MLPGEVNPDKVPNNGWISYGTSDRVLQFNMTAVEFGFDYQVVKRLPDSNHEIESRDASTTLSPAQSRRSWAASPR